MDIINWIVLGFFCALFILALYFILVYNEPDVGDCTGLSH